MQMS